LIHLVNIILEKPAGVVTGNQSPFARIQATALSLAVGCLEGVAGQNQETNTRQFLLTILPEITSNLQIGEISQAKKATTDFVVAIKQHVIEYISRTDNVPNGTQMSVNELHQLFPIFDTGIKSDEVQLWTARPDNFLPEDPRSDSMEEVYSESQEQFVKHASVEIDLLKVLNENLLMFRTDQENIAITQALRKNMFTASSGFLGWSVRKGTIFFGTIARALALPFVNANQDLQRHFEKVADPKGFRPPTKIPESLVYLKEFIHEHMEFKRLYTEEIKQNPKGLPREKTKAILMGLFGNNEGRVKDYMAAVKAAALYGPGGNECAAVMYTFPGEEAKGGQPAIVINLDSTAYLGHGAMNWAPVWYGKDFDDILTRDQRVNAAKLFKEAAKATVQVKTVSSKLKGLLPQCKLLLSEIAIPPVGSVIGLPLARCPDDDDEREKLADLVEMNVTPSAYQAGSIAVAGGGIAVDDVPSSSINSNKRGPSTQDVVDEPLPKGQGVEGGEVGEVGEGGGTRRRRPATAKRTRRKAYNKKSNKRKSSKKLSRKKISRRRQSRRK